MVASNIKTLIFADDGVLSCKPSCQKRAEWRVNQLRPERPQILRQIVPALPDCGNLPRCHDLQLGGQRRLYPWYEIHWSPEGAKVPSTLTRAMMSTPRSCSPMM